MFNIDNNPTFTETVKVTEPGGTKSDFKATFLALDIPAFAAYDIETPDGIKDMLTATLQSVDDIVDRKGTAVPDTEDLRQRLIGLAWVRIALLRAYLEGVNAAARGN